MFLYLFIHLFCFQGEWVWVDLPNGVPIGARVKVTPSGQRLLVDDEGKVNAKFLAIVIENY